MRGKFEYLQLPNHIQFETVSQATKLLEKRRMLYEVHEAFEQQKDEYNRKKEGLQKEEKSIRETDLMIQEQLIKYGASLVETTTKTNKAHERFIEEERNCIKKENEIQKQDLEIQKLQSHTSILDEKVQMLEKYEMFLDNVINQNSDQYSDVGDLLKRYTTLKRSNKKLEEDKEKFENTQTRLTEELANYNKRCADEILIHTNDISNLQNRLEVR